MKKTILIFLACLAPAFTFASSILNESFEYANNDLTTPTGWTSDDQSWLCGHLEKDHNRMAYSGEWYAFTNADDSWMFVQLYMSSQLKYRYSCWAISDGTYDLEFWAGDEDNVTHMSQLLFTVTVSGGNYEHVSAFIDTITANYPYLGIHAIAAEGAYHLTIDDIDVSMVSKYEFAADPVNANAAAYPGEQITFRFDVTNLGYEPIDVIISPSHEYFTDFHFTVEGTPCTVFHLEPEERKQVIATATLLSNVTAGTTCWLDIMLVLDCNCATAMTTLWVTVMDPVGTAENETNPVVYPNPATDYIIVDGKDLQQVEVTDLSGKKFISIPADPDELRLELTQLPAGIYFVTTHSERGTSTQKLLKR